MKSDSTLGIRIAGIAATVDNNRITRNKIVNSQKTIQNKKKIMFSTKIIGLLRIKFVCAPFKISSSLPSASIFIN